MHSVKEKLNKKGCQLYILSHSILWQYRNGLRYTVGVKYEKAKDDFI